MPALAYSSFTRTDNVRLGLSTMLGLVGTAASLATIYATPLSNAFVLSCGLQALNCDTALTSRLAAVAGVPLGVLGAAYFLFWTLNVRAFHRTRGEIFQFSLTWATTLGAIVSVGLGAYMLGVLHRPCLYCLLTHAANLGACVLLWPFRRWRRPAETSGGWHFASMTAVALLAATAVWLAHDARQARAALKKQRPATAQWETTPPITDIRPGAIQAALARASRPTPPPLPARNGLWSAAAANDVPKLHELLAAGAKPDERDASGHTPLMHAAQHLRFNALRTLLQAGADPALATPRGDLAVDFVTDDQPESRPCALLLRAYAFLRKNARPPAARPARPNLVLLFEPTVNYLHPRIAQSYYLNTAERDGQPGVDDDSNGFVDDIYGWNLDANEAHTINPFQYRLYLENRDLAAKLFTAHNDYKRRKLSEEAYRQVRGGFTNPFARIFGQGAGQTDGDFLDQAMSLAHGSHVAGIVLEHSRGEAQLHTLSWKAFGESKDLTELLPASELARKYPDNFLQYLEHCRAQVLAESLASGRRLSDYLRTTGAGVANLSMGMNFESVVKSVRRLATTYMQVNQRELTATQQEDLLRALQPAAFELYVAGSIWTLLPAFENPDVLFVIAAGNDGASNDETLQSPAYLSRFLPNVITVAAASELWGLAGFSNHGPLSVDLAAPGVNILSTVIPEASVMMNGTSMATPAVAGAAAWLRKQRPDLTAAQMKKLLIYSARPDQYLTRSVASGAELNAKLLFQLADPDPAAHAKAAATIARRAIELDTPTYPDHLTDAEWIRQLASGPLPSGSSSHGQTP